MSNKEGRLLVAARIKEARLAARLTQIEVAQSLDLSRVSITIMETGTRHVTADEILHLAKIFGVNPLFLLGLSPDMLAADDPKIQLAMKAIQKLKPADLGELLDLLAMLSNKFQDGTDQSLTQILRHAFRPQHGNKPKPTQLEIAAE
jgi:transcriptional regulator with XRE-family HTH domain